MSSHLTNKQQAMKKDQVRIIFYGTAPFATACLERLVDEGYPLSLIHI